MHPQQVRDWKRQLLDQVADVFSGKQDAGRKQPSEERDRLYQKVGELHTDNITWGGRLVRDRLRLEGWKVSGEHIQRLMRLMPLQVVYPKPKLTRLHPSRAVYPCLLRDLR